MRRTRPGASPTGDTGPSSGSGEPRATSNSSVASCIPPMPSVSEWWTFRIAAARPCSKPSTVVHDHIGRAGSNASMPSLRARSRTVAESPGAGRLHAADVPGQVEALVRHPSRRSEMERRLDQVVAKARNDPARPPESGEHAARDRGHGRTGVPLPRSIEATDHAPCTRRTHPSHACADRLEPPCRHLGTEPRTRRETATRVTCPEDSVPKSGYTDRRSVPTVRA